MRDVGRAGWKREERRERPVGEREAGERRGADKNDAEQERGAGTRALGS